MPTANDYALLAANSYAASAKVVSDKNSIPMPSGWSGLGATEMSGNGGVNNATGFLARAYRNGANEIVIAYAGTTFEDGMKSFDWKEGNIPGASGFSLAEQIVDAATFYLDVRRANSDANITFTGHSLGGGLASLMAVYFDKAAYTFDQAPFERSANSASVVNELKQRLSANYALTDLAPEFSTYIPGQTNLAREGRVQHTYVRGEVLRNLGAYFAAFGFGVGGPAGALVGYGLAAVASEIAATPANVIDAGTGAAATDLHSIVLLAALQQSQKFLDVAKANQELLQEVFRSPLNYGQDDPLHRNFLNLMVQQQISGTQALDNFADDLAKFTGALNPTLDNKLKSALYGLAISLYYGAAENGIGTSTPLDVVFKSLTGGIQFTPDPSRQNEYSSQLAAVLQELGQYFPEVGEYLNPTADRYTLSTTGPLVAAAAADDKSDLMLGSAQGDELSGGGGDDVLLGRAGGDRLDGGAGKDTLYGGQGADTLIGGEGDDLYVFYSGDGADTIVDEGVNRILYDGRSIAGMAIKDPSTGQYKFVDDAGKTLEFHSPGVLTLADGAQITFQNQTSAEMLDGSFGLHLYEEQAAADQFDNTFLGDLAPKDDPVKYDSLGNAIVGGNAQPGREDSFQDSAGNDLIRSLGGDDFIYSWRGGDDRIEGGDGDDWMVGGMGNDIVVGGTGRDSLVEGYGKDKLYADEVMSVADAIAAGSAAGTGLQGEALSGGADDDLLIGGAGNDVLLGGEGDDIVIAGAGDDNIDSDAMTGNIVPTWTVNRSVDTSNGTTAYWREYVGFNGMWWPAVGGNDAIYAGAGADWVSAGYGNDYIDGGNDEDVLFGEGDNDDVFGGAGNDVLVGDGGDTPMVAQGDDYLDGEDGDDTLYGDGGSDMLFGGNGSDKIYADDDTTNAGYDYLDGGAGNDRLFGGALDDELFGGADADFLQGDSGTGVDDGDDMLDGEDGDDILIGEGGSDELYGGAGNDQIAGDHGGYDTSGEADTIFGEAGNDIIDGQGGDDVIDAGADNDLVAGGLGNDLISGGTGDDQLQGGDGDDSIEGGDGFDTLFGEAGNDSLHGGAGTDYLIGGLGNDTLNGGDGDDYYFYSTGEGIDHISDSGGTDMLVFNDVTWGQVTLGTGSLKLNVPGGEIHLDDFNPDNPYAAGGIEYFQFSDGSVWTKSQLISTLGIAPTGTPEADVLSGTSLSETIRALAGDDVVTARGGNDTVYADDGSDVVYGGDGNDIIYGGNGDDSLLGEGGGDTLRGEGGNDLLSGGAGADTLEGGDGDDVYLFQRGDGQDTATDTLGINSIALGEGLTLDAIVFARQGNDLAVSIKNTTDRLTVKDWFAAGSHFETVTLADGTVLDHAGVDDAMPKNQAPLATADNVTVTEDSVTYVSGNALANDSDPEGHVLRVTNPGTYAGAVGTLALNGNGTYSYSLSNGLAAVQSLGAGQTLTEHFTYTVTDDDPNGAATAESAIVVTVRGTNDLPVLGADSAATTEDAGPIGGNVLTNDRDVDAGTTLTVANVGTFNGAYGSLTLGTDGTWNYSLANATAAVQSLAAGQIVTDTFAVNVSDGMAQVAGSLAVSIAGQNDAPILVAALADQSASANSSWTWQLPAGSFTDVDAGDVLNYGATLADGTALPSWLAFDAATQTFSGRVPKSATGSIDIRVGATDRLGANAADVFTLSFDGSTGGGGGGGGGGNGGSLGNEGVGNGVDAAPPGHDDSFNDGPGTQPGSPGAQGGNGYQPQQKTDIVISQVQVETVASQPVMRGGSAGAPGQQKKQAATGSDVLADAPEVSQGALSGSQDDSGVVDAATTADESGWDHLPATPAFLNSSHWSAYYDALADSSSGSGTSYVGRWIEMDLALSRALADNKPLSSLDDAFAADVGGLAKASAGWLGTSVAFREDAFSLLAGNGQNLKTFQGMGHGTKQIA